jgi:hypothetical protein
VGPDFSREHLKAISNPALLYDRYEAIFQDLQVSLLDQGLKPTSLARGEGVQLLKRLNARIDIYNCLEPQHPLHPSLELTFIINSLDLEVGISSLYITLAIEEALLRELCEYHEIVFFKFAENSA